MSVFTYRGPLPPDSPIFRGRTAELAQLTRLCQREVEAYAIVYGGRQTGKTSLLLRLANNLPAHVQTCRIDFQGLPGATTGQVYAYLAQRVTSSLSHLETTPEIQNAPGLIEFLSQAVSHPETGQLVLFLEELGAIPQNSREDLAHVLRSVFTNRFDPAYRSLTRLMVVLAGGIELYELAATQVSPLQNICEPIYLPNLSEEQATGLAKDGLTDLGLDSVNAEILAHAIYTHVDGHPYLVQRLGGALEANMANGQTPTPDLVKHAVEQLLSGDSLLHHLRTALDEHCLLAASQDLLAGRLRFSRLDDEMARLELLGLARETNGHWTARNRLLARALEDWLTTANQSTEATTLVNAPTENIAALEIRLRDFIHHRLTGVISPYYWKDAIPGDVITHIKKRIKEHLERHPYKTWSDFPTGRVRLEFCDVSHYEKIILKNWPQFEELFQRKEEFQRHITAYRTLRNCVQHNREPTDVEQLSGKAAIAWLERILDQYNEGENK
ncbi:MAG: hypothetical protein GY832_09560 [Chloroflexi bacterium]|nr:hypothetical protein [Chloroflexota bacterium]